jgi:hypothetical protein
MRLFSRNEIFRPFIEANKMERVVPKSKDNKNFDRTIRQLFEECGGSSFQDGLYRVHTAEASSHWAKELTRAYPQVKGKFIPIAYDWLGRQFASDVERRNVILLFDPATMKYYDIGFDIVTFHNQLLVKDRDSALSEVFFSKLLRHFDVGNLGYARCIGHKKPLFLGGTDDVDNFEITDLEVFWDFQYQIYQQIKDLPDGTPIGKITYQPKQ